MIGNVVDMSRDAQSTLSHPLIDEIVEGIAVSESRAPLLALTSTRTDLLLQAGRARHPLVFLTGDGTRLTEAMRAALADTRIPWVVRTAGGLRDGLTWRPLADLAAAFDSAPAAPHPDALYLEQPTTLQLVASVSVRHRADASTRLGAALEILGRPAEAAPVAWGPNEPAEFAWDRDALTAFARARMPSDTRLIATGDTARPMVATLTARRTARGVEEVTEALVSLGRLDDPATDARADATVELLDELAVTPWPLMAAVFTRPGRADLTTSAFVAPTPRPLALLIGAPAVRDLALDAAIWAERFGARVAGRPRTPALVIPLRRSEEPAEIAWNRLVEITETLGVERVAELTGFRLDIDEWRSR